MKEKELKAKIKAIPDDGEWFHISNEETFLDLAKILIEKGFSEEGAISFLERAYYTIAGEFGL